MSTPNGPRDTDLWEARDAVERVVQALGDILGRASRWSGMVQLEEFAFHAGVIRPGGGIGILHAVWEDGGAQRYRTVIHEALHTFSPVYTIKEYRDQIGWEEGVVEQLQRLLRQEVLGRIGVDVPGASFADTDAIHPFNDYIAEFEALRGLLEAEQFDNPIAAEDYYKRLLLIPLSARLDALLRAGEQLPEPKQIAFKTRLMVANARLRRTRRGF